MWSELRGELTGWQSNMSLHKSPVYFWASNKHLRMKLKTIYNSIKHDEILKDEYRYILAIIYYVIMYIIKIVLIYHSFTYKFKVEVDKLQL